MLFLVRSEATIPSALTMEEAAPMLEKTWEMLERHEKEGKIVAGGRVAGTRFAYFVVDVNSPDELDEMFASSPMYNYVDLEIMPLTSISSALQRVREWTRAHPGETQSGDQGTPRIGQQGEWPAV